MPGLAWLGLEWRGRCGILRNLLWFKWGAVWGWPGWMDRLLLCADTGHRVLQAAALCADTLISVSFRLPALCCKQGDHDGLVLKQSLLRLGEMSWRGGDCCSLWWEEGTLSHYHEVFDCAVSNVHLRACHSICSVPVTFLLPSFYLLPTDPCTQPVCVLDTITGVPHNSRGS